MTIFEKVRADRLSLADVLKKHRGIRKLVEDLYPDNAHFIYELLQNAEDAGATEASFALEKNNLSFAHNGRPFTENDIWGITDIGEGTKAGDEDKIGCFGIGFKAVFAYTETPHVWSPTFSFRLFDMVLPETIASKPGLEQQTRFEFPFNSPKKAVGEAYAEIEFRLGSLAETTLLFLPSLRLIRWKVGDAATVEVERVHHSTYHVEVLKKAEGRVEARSHLLLFEQPVEGLTKKRLAIAFHLDFLPKVDFFEPKKPLAKQMKIVPANPGCVAVYFPAEKETSGLRFHLHAPFVPEVSRASVKETVANEPLFQQLAELTAASLDKIRTFDLLNADFLQVLPNPRDDLGCRYKCIREAIVHAMNNQPLTPEHFGKHAPANRLLQARAAFKELLSDEDLAFLVGGNGGEEQPPQWAIGATQQNSRIDHFLKGLAIRNWDVAEIAKKLNAFTTDGHAETSNSPFYAWLEKKPLDWHQRLYALLSEHLARRDYPGIFYAKSFKIVRLSDGDYRTGSRCFFPSDGVEHDEVMPRVARAVYTSGKNEQQQKAARAFLEEIGVREVGEAEQVEAILQRRYRGASFEPRDQDLERFVALVEREPQKAKIFAESCIFQSTDGKWRRPCQVFLDKPFLDTGLSAYFQVFGDDAPKSAIAQRYEKGEVQIERLVKFAKAVGAQELLAIETTKCRGNPKWHYLHEVNGDLYTDWAIDQDYAVPCLDTALAQPTLELSRLVWRTLCSLSPYACVWQATYQKNRANGSRTADSQFAHVLTTSAWVPQTNGSSVSFVRPTDAASELLPGGFPFDKTYPWLSKIRFGETNQQVVQKLQAHDAAREWGFRDADTLERAQQFATLPQDEQEWLLAESRRRQSRQLPRHEPRDPDRRAERVRQEAVHAPPKTFEERTRSVSVGRDDIKKHVEPYLLGQYTIDGEMICQICKKQLPFKLDDGKWYFEKVELLVDLAKHHHQNYLALCPNHAAMFQHANGSKEMLRDLFSQVEGNELEVVLAQQETTIYFTGTHIVDLKAVIDTEQAG